ncbi:MAG: undecaprenyl-diphosphate phosphatase [Holosporaceae bacterium]|jgi:undecaprenyl-diphosphatase|nr:undecaprenyl-diphosphate phosphatase [Holosporaceae bacterium]
MTFFDASIVGAIQGVTEFLPVSSSAHVVLLSRLFNIPYQGKAFDIFLNIGTLLAIFVFFRQYVRAIFLGGIDFIINKKSDNNYLFRTIVISSIPTIVAFGILEAAKVHIDSSLVLSISLILFAIILYFCDRNPEDKTIISRKDSLLVGLVQPLSFIPGVSRLGICLSMMRFLKYSREESFRYSMLLSIPPVIGACSIKLIHVFMKKTVIYDWSMVAVGSISAFVFGMISINLVSKFLRHHTFLLIIIYRILFGLFILSK